MSWSAKWIWKPETPGSEPAGARISAGKSGKVARSLPRIAVSFVNYLNELPYFCDEVLPRLARLGVRENP